MGGLVWYTIKSISALYSSDAPARDYIPIKDREILEGLIKSNQNDGLRIFKEFISLYGFTGNITRLGLSGLPLLTVALTLFFSILAAMVWFIGLFLHNASAGQDIGRDIDTAIMDLAKLTLGAFIGSFVQRNVSERAAAEVSSDKEKEDEPRKEGGAH